MNTKQCKYCLSQIPKRANVCPRCGRKQGGKLKLVISVVFLIALFSIICFYPIKVSLDNKARDAAEESQKRAEYAEQAANELLENGEIESTYEEYKEKADTTPDPTEGMDKATQNAYRSAKNYLSLMGFSKQGLIDQLTSEYGDGYTVEQATAAVQALEDNGEVDWNEQAVKCAESYDDLMAFSRDGLIEQLTSEYGEQFTIEQATYAVDQIGL